MRRPRTQRKCKHCQTFFAPDPRSARRQRSCAKLACRQASKAASQHRWLQKPGNRDYFGCVPPFTRGILGHEIGLVLGRALRPLVQAYL